MWLVTDMNDNIVEEVDKYGIALIFVNTCIKKILNKFYFNDKTLEIKDRVIVNFIAKSLTLLESINTLFVRCDFYSGWIMLRCIIERIFILRDLETTNSYDEYRKWSFIQKYEYMHKINSSPEFKEKAGYAFFNDYKKLKNQYIELKKENINWKRPDNLKIAKAMNLKFLYYFGYDYSSGYIHSLDDDGEEDLYFILGKKYKFVKKDFILLNNAFLAVILLTQEGLNNSSFSWIKVLYETLDSIIEYINGERIIMTEIKNKLDFIKEAVICVKTK